MSVVYECKCLPQDVAPGGVPCKGCLRMRIQALEASVDAVREKATMIAETCRDIEARYFGRFLRPWGLVDILHASNDLLAMCEKAQSAGKEEAGHGS